MSEKRMKPGKKEVGKNRPHLIEIDHYTSEFDRIIIEQENELMNESRTPRNRAIRKREEKLSYKKYKLFRERRKNTRPGITRTQIERGKGKSYQKRGEFIEHDRIEGLLIIRENTPSKKTKKGYFRTPTKKISKMEVDIGFESQEEIQQKEKLRKILREHREKNKRSR